MGIRNDAGLVGLLSQVFGHRSDRRLDEMSVCAGSWMSGCRRRQVVIWTAPNVELRGCALLRPLERGVRPSVLRS